MPAPDAADPRAAPRRACAGTGPAPAALLQEWVARSAPAGPLAVAVSGGSDSLALLVLLAEAGLAAAVYTVDHGLRPEAAAEARMVAGVAARLGLAHRTLQWRWDGRGNLAEAARAGRYRALAAAARADGLAACALGHTRGDNVETLMLGLSRGAGLDGLCGMRAGFVHEGVGFHRPLLAAPREALRGVLRRRGLGWAEDPGNVDPSHARARIRQALAVLALPEARLARSLTHLAGLRRALGDELARLLDGHWHEEGPDLLLDLRVLRRMGPEFRRRTLAAALRRVGGAPHGPRGPALARLAALDWLRAGPEGAEPEGGDRRHAGTPGFGPPPGAGHGEAGRLDDPAPDPQHFEQQRTRPRRPRARHNDAAHSDAGPSGPAHPDRQLAGSHPLQARAPAAPRLDPGPGDGRDCGPQPSGRQAATLHGCLLRREGPLLRISREPAAAAAAVAAAGTGGVWDRRWRLCGPGEGAQLRALGRDGLAALARRAAEGRARQDAGRRVQRPDPDPAPDPEPGRAQAEMRERARGATQELTQVAMCESAQGVTQAAMAAPERPPGHGGTYEEAHGGTREDAQGGANGDERGSAHGDAHESAQERARGDAQKGAHEGAQGDVHEGAHGDADGGAHGNARGDAHESAQEDAQDGAQGGAHAGAQEDARGGADGDAQGSARGGPSGTLLRPLPRESLLAAPSVWRGGELRFCPFAGDPGPEAGLWRCEDLAPGFAALIRG